MLHRILKKMYPEGDTYVRVHMKEEKLLDKMAESAAQVMGKIIGVKQQEEKKKPHRALNEGEKESDRRGC